MGQDVIRSNSKQVLIVDGDEEVLISLEKLLEDAGFRTTTSWTAADAKRFLRSEQYDVVLTSEYLPDCSCEEFLRSKKKNDATHWIVMQSASPRMTRCERLSKLGADAVVCKHQKQQLLDTVCRMTESPRAAAWLAVFR